MELHEWAFPTASWRERSGEAAGSTATDDAWLRPWDSDNESRSWRGWWGESPPYGHDVFMLSHYARDPLSMDGGTTFHFVTD